MDKYQNHRIELLKEYITGYKDGMQNQMLPIYTIQSSKYKKAYWDGYIEGVRHIRKIIKTFCEKIA